VILVKVIALIVSPLLEAFVYRPKSKRTLIPPIRSRLLTLSVQELRRRLQSRQVITIKY